MTSVLSDLSSAPHSRRRGIKLKIVVYTLALATLLGLGISVHRWVANTYTLTPIGSFVRCDPAIHDGKPVNIYNSDGMWQEARCIPRESVGQRS